MTVSPPNDLAARRGAQLAAERKSLDYRMARWAHDLRAEFPPGDVGDKAFHKWLETETAMPPKEREAMLDLARSFKEGAEP